MPTSVMVLERSDALRQGFKECYVKYPNLDLQLMLSDEPNAVIGCDDTLFIGEDLFYIHATNNGQFYLTACMNDPTETPEEYAVLSESIRFDLDHGVIPLPTIAPKCYYGAYFDEVEAAVLAARTWIDISPTLIPRCYTPPVQTYR